MANPPPLPPVVDGPIYNTSTQVYVDNLLPDSTVTVYNGPSSTNVVGTGATSSSPGAIWVTLSSPISQNIPTLLTSTACRPTMWRPLSHSR